MQAELTRPAGRTIPPAQLDLHLGILTRIARGGLHIPDAELRYQLARHAQPSERLPQRLADLQRRGLIEAETHYRLTRAGAQLLPADQRPAERAIGGIPWANQPLPPPLSRRPARRRAAPMAPTAASAARG
jgi:hypothetical protein